MQSINASRFPATQIRELVVQLPFFQVVQREAPDDMECLLQHARVVVVQPGDTVVEQGEFDALFYFVLKGELRVHAGSGADAALVAYLGVGEMFGALAAIGDAERNATVRAAASRGALLLGVDFSPFGERDDFSLISVASKCAFYRQVVADTEARLRSYEQDMPGTDLGERLADLPAVAAADASPQQLQELATRLEALTPLLLEWNLTLQNLPDYQPPRPPLKGDLLGDLERLYFP